MSSTKSIVLSCAGIGSRLGLAQTKALINIGGKSLIAWQLELFQNIDDLRIVIGYQANDVIREVLKYRKDVVFVYNHDYFATKTGTSFYLGSKDANEYVLEWDGDLLVHPDDITKILETPGEFLGYSHISSDDAVFVKTRENGDVCAFSTEQGDYEWTGPACVKKDKLKYTSGHVYGMLEPYLPLPGLLIRANDIDTYDDFQRAIEFVKSW